MLKGDNLELYGIDVVGAKYYSYLQNYDVMKYFGSVTQVHTDKTMQEWLDKTNKDPNKRFWGIYYFDEFIGTTRLDINWIFRNAILSIMIGDTNHWGKGIGTEVIGIVKDYAFKTLNLHKLESGYLSGNIASQRIFEKNGFKVEGIQEDHRFVDGKYVNAVLMGVINDKPQ